MMVHADKNTDIPGKRGMLRGLSGCKVLRDEREKRGLSRAELADLAAVSEAWIRDIETKGERPGADAAARIRAALEECPIHRKFGVKCDHKLPVPPDNKLYSKQR